MFRTANGIGESARKLHKSLSIPSLTPLAVDTSDLLNQVDIDANTKLSEMPDKSHGTLILVANAPETEVLLHLLKMRRWKQWRIIGYWAWELSQLPSSWTAASKFCSEIWTPSDFTKRTCQNALRLPVKTVPIPVQVPTNTTLNTNLDELSFLTLADGRSSFERKNLFAAIQIFLAAFSNSGLATMTIKIRNGDEYPEFKKKLLRLVSEHTEITLLDASLSHKEHWKLIAAHSAVLSTHRAEGFGIHLAEAMALGKVVVATGWSGNLQFMTEQNSLLLSYQLVPVEDKYGVYQNELGAKWAEVDIEASKEILLQLAANPSIRKRLGKQAKTDIQLKLSGQNVVDALLDQKPS